MTDQSSNSPQPELAQISDPNNEEKRLADQANHDFLTGLYNRRYFYQLVSEALQNRTEAAHVYGLMLIDVDDFKQINEHFGHLAGDEILKFVALRLRDSASSDKVLARISGDEFGLLLEGDDCGEQLLKTSRKIIAALATPIHFELTQIKVSVSIGMAVFPYHGTALSDLLRCADLALCEAKRKGKNNE